MKNNLCDVSDMNKTFEAIISILRDIFEKCYFVHSCVLFIRDNILKNNLCNVSDMNKTFEAIISILQDIFVNEASLRRVFNMAVSPSTAPVGFCDCLLFVNILYDCSRSQ